MAKFIKGDVVVLPFPFTDLSSSKKRPAVILADITGDDYIMLQITSKNVKDSYAIPLVGTDFSAGSLQQDSNIRPNKIFTLDGKLILYRIGHLNNSKIEECVNKVCDIIKEIP
ncbi:MAG: type II toxin-antitoxin system PemK/MazF family toxin [Lachnospiraceae bacterium]|nr:type II toxin-antitoxin system PemK/MazF family toxin [Lachnospiraceae bacterium]